MNATENEKKRLEERNRIDMEIAELMKESNKFLCEGKYHEAWLLAMRAKDIDPDNQAIVTPNFQADLAVDVEPGEKIEGGDWKSATESKPPLALRAEAGGRPGERTGVSAKIACTNPLTTGVLPGRC